MPEDAHIIDRYTRAQAIEDGVLVDLAEGTLAALVREAGVTVPLAMTRNAYTDTVALTPDAELAGATEEGRLRHMLARLRDAMRRAPPEDTMVTFTVEVIRHDCRIDKVRLWAIVDGGDDGAPAMTVMLPEDY